MRFGIQPRKYLPDSCFKHTGIIMLVKRHMNINPSATFRGIQIEELHFGINSINYQFSRTTNMHIRLMQNYTTLNTDTVNYCNYFMLM